MSVDKAQVVEILRARGDHELADRVNRELPAAFDPSPEWPLAGPLDDGTEQDVAVGRVGVRVPGRWTRWTSGDALNVSIVVTTSANGCGSA